MLPSAMPHGTIVELQSYKDRIYQLLRKADPQAVTPSKPRSGVLNYLLNAVIPVGTLNHEESISFRKKNTTSSWAMSAIVALCSKTGERGHDRHRDLADNVDEPDLLFVRKFVLEHALKAYKDANASTEALGVKYSRMLCIADLFNQMLTSRPYHGGTATNAEIHTVPQKQIARIMFEKNFISALTSSIADIDLNFPGSKRVVKYILRPLKQLTQAAITLSETSSITTSSGHIDEDEISTASSVSDMDDDREENARPLSKFYTWYVRTGSGRIKLRVIGGRRRNV
jgi:E3 ubiquitin-protein ligase HUWE1